MGSKDKGECKGRGSDSGPRLCDALILKILVVRVFHPALPLRSQLCSFGSAQTLDPAERIQACAEPPYIRGLARPSIAIDH